MKIDLITDVQQISAEIARNRDDIQALAQRIAVLERSHSEFDSCLDTPEFHAQLKQVVQVTQEMFGNADIQIEHDPEDPEVSYVVLTVGVAGAATELVGRRIEWHRCIRPLTADNHGLFRLSMLPVE